jgi:transcriptional regulator with XRE-family HTH domain
VRLVLRNDQDKYEIGENIRLAREAQGMSQDDLADLVGTSRKAVSRYEIGTTEMGIVTFFQYAEALNSRPEAFFPERLFIQQDQTQTDELEAIIGTLSKEDRDILLTMAKRMQSGKK